MSRCKCCDFIMKEWEMSSDSEMCSFCRGKSMETGSMDDKDYEFGGLTGIYLDGTILTIDPTWREDKREEDYEN